MLEKVRAFVSKEAVLVVAVLQLQCHVRWCLLTKAMRRMLIGAL